MACCDQDEDDDSVTELLARYPLQDIGLVLIRGSLPDGVITYDVTKIFQIDSQAPAPAPTVNGGYGLVFKVENETAHVQYGNCVRTIAADSVFSKHDVFVTGLPFPPL